MFWTLRLVWLVWFWFNSIKYILYGQFDGLKKLGNEICLFSPKIIIATLGSNLGISALLEILQDASWTTKWYYNHWVTHHPHVNQT